MNRDKPNRVISLFALAMCLFSLSRITVITASPAPADSVHSHMVFDYEPWRWEHPLPAAKLAADLNVGEPRTVRMIYFLPKDRQPQPDIDATFDTLIRQVQQSYAEQMENHGFGRRTFQFETDADGRALVHHVKGEFDDVHYRTDMFDTVWDEVTELFDPTKNIYLVSLDVSDAPYCGLATSWGPEGGMAVIDYEIFENEHAWACGNVAVIAHELGHTFGLAHDYFRNAIRSPSSYHTDWMVTSFAAAEWLAAHRYFNVGQSYPERNEPTTIQMHPPRAVPPNAIRLRFEVTDYDGLHQTQLHNSTGEAVDFRGVNGEMATVEFVTPEVTEAPGNEVELRVVDVYGNVRRARHPIDILALLTPENVSIPDGNLAAVLRDTLDLAPGETVTQLDMLKLRKLHASSRQITDLTGLEHAVNLTELELHRNEIQDITPLAGLIILEVLGLRNNNISDIQPLMQMKNLQRLWLSGNSVSDLSTLAGLTNLKVISLWRNPIGSTTPLHGLLRRNPFLDIHGVTIFASLYLDTQIESPAENNNVLELIEKQPGDTIQFQLFAPDVAGQQYNAFELELTLPGKTFSSYISSVSGDWIPQVLGSGNMRLTLLSINPVTVPDSGYLGQIDLAVTRALTSEATLIVQSAQFAGMGGIQNLAVSNAALTFVQAVCPGDFDNNGIVNIADFLLFVKVFGTSSGDATYNALMDMDGSGMIGIPDFLLFVGVFGTTCE